MDEELEEETELELELELEEEVELEEEAEGVALSPPPPQPTSTARHPVSINPRNVANFGRRANIMYCPRNAARSDNQMISARP